MGFQMKGKFPVLLISPLSLGYVPLPLELCPRRGIKIHFFAEKGRMLEDVPTGQVMPLPRPVAPGCRGAVTFWAVLSFTGS